MKNLLFIASGPPAVLQAPDVVSTWLRRYDSIYRGLEIATANVLADAYGKLYFMTYEDQGCKIRYQNVLAPNIHVLFKPRSIPSSIYRIVGPLIFRRYFKDVNICRTGFKGCFTAIVMKLLYGGKLVLRYNFQRARLTREVLNRMGSRRPFRAYAFFVGASFLELVANHLADAITVSSNASRDYITGRYHVDSRKVFVLPNWVDVAKFRPLQQVKKEGGRIIFVGKLDPIKNIFSLVDAIKGITGARLYIAGGGPLKEVLERKLHEEAIHNVVLMGIVPHHRLPVELNRAEVFVLPSFYEEIPKALLEAMACGLPVVGTDVTGVSDVIKTGSTGLLCKTSANSLRSAIERLLADASLRSRLGSNAR
ncbi:glycosyltransferase family 4 protein [[Eubacterium] cellulosolvens]